MTVPPGPEAPGVVQLASWVARPRQLLDACQRRYGDVFTLRLPGLGPIVIVAAPDLIRTVFAAEPDVLLAGAGNATVLEPMLGRYSLLTLDGDAHLRQRRLLLPAFHGARMQGFAAVMRDVTHASLDRWPVRSPFALHPFMQSITLDVILPTIFGVADGGAQLELRRALVELLEISASPWLLLPGAFGVDVLAIPWLRVTRLKREIDARLYRVIDERRQRPTGGTDVLSMLIAARDERGEAMTDVEVRDELVTLLLAGHETTATSLAWTFERLLAHPATLERLQTDLAAGRDEYLDAVIRETLRVRPIVPLIARYVARPFRLGAWTIPVGARIAPSIYLAGRDPATYPAPDRFEPERWLGVKPDPYAWLPFGGGLRRCIGMAFAQLEMRVVVQTVVRRTRMHLADREVRVVRRGITLAPSGGTRIVLDERLARGVERAA